MSKHHTFDVYFNTTAEDTYLVQYLSQHLRDRGLSTYDRSVDRIPLTEIETLSEYDALDNSLVMIHVITDNTEGDEAMGGIVAKALADSKRIIVIDFDGRDVAPELSGCHIIHADRTHLKEVEREIDRLLEI